jgi:hypothetical protein
MAKTSPMDLAGTSEAPGMYEEAASHVNDFSGPR